MTVGEAIRTIVNTDVPVTHDDLVNLYWDLPLWEQDAIDRVAAELPTTMHNEDYPENAHDVAMRVWARLKADGSLVSHVYQEDEVLF